MNSLAVDLLYGNVYCFICGSYVYDGELEQIGRDEADKAAWIAGCGKRKYFEWQPNDLEAALLTMTTKRRKISKDSIVGKSFFISNETSAASLYLIPVKNIASPEYSLIARNYFHTIF